MMKINFVKHTNIDNNRLEFLFVNFDYIDGNDLITKIFKEKFDMNVGEKIDGFFYSIIPLSKDGIEYKLVWHEDDGNSIYCEKQNIQEIEKLEKMLVIIIEELNKKFKNN